MNSMHTILKTAILQENLRQYIKSETVSISVEGNRITLIPQNPKEDCPNPKHVLAGRFSSTKNIVDEHLASRAAERGYTE
jgi:hypothetical protein